MSHKLYIYNSENGYTEENIDGNHDIFRKILNIDKYSDMIEFEIAKRLLKNPCKNIVTIYNVFKTKDICYIDMENLNDEYVKLSETIDSLQYALKHLHSLGIVYIDIKTDNIGKSIDGNYKLFDFDNSGIVDIKNSKIWCLRPTDECIIYNSVKKYEFSLTELYELDHIILKIKYNI